MPHPGSESSARICRSPDCAVRSVAGETILVPIRSGVADLECVYTLNDVGEAIWRLLESPRSEEEIVFSIVSEFDVEEADARRDVAEFLADLQVARLAVPEETK